MDNRQPAAITHLGAALEDEHHAIDSRLEDFLAGRGGPDAAAERLREAITCLRRHIYLEEEFLFPPLRESGLMAPIFVMLAEHGELWQTMDALEAQLEDSPLESQRDTCTTLLARLERHNTKEEPIIYPHADTTLSEDARAELIDFIQHEEMPPGWVCQRAAQG